MDKVFVFALTAAFNPTLLAAVTLMLLLDHPKRLLLGYLCGALMTSITLGLVIVFSVQGSSSTTDAARHQLDPALDIALGALILTIAFVVGTGRDQRRRARSARKKAEKAGKPPARWQRTLSGGSARTAFVVGALLTLPGASYLAGLAEISRKDISDATTVLYVIAFNVIMLALLEVPLLGYTLSPEKTAATVHRLDAWLRRDGGRILLLLAVLIGLALIGRGIDGLLA